MKNTKVTVDIRDKCTWESRVYLDQTAPRQKLSSLCLHSVPFYQTSLPYCQTILDDQHVSVFKKLWSLVRLKTQSNISGNDGTTRFMSLKLISVGFNIPNQLLLKPPFIWHDMKCTSSHIWGCKCYQYTERFVCISPDARNLQNLYPENKKFAKWSTTTCQTCVTVTGKLVKDLILINF